VPAFPAPDGTEIAYHIIGSGPESSAPVICLPGGPMRASAYLGDLGGLATRRRLILLDLRGTGESGHPADSASYRCDRQVGDVEALRLHLGLDQMDVLAHSAGGSLAVRYAAGYPHRIGALALITPSIRAVGIEVSADARRRVLALRRDEPWYPAAAAGFEAITAGRARRADRIAVTPTNYGRWDGEPSRPRRRRCPAEAREAHRAVVDLAVPRADAGATEQVPHAADDVAGLEEDVALVLAYRRAARRDWSRVSSRATTS
jgi:proline iminopeptidase